MRISDWSSDVCSSDLGVIDFDRAVRDPAQPERLLPAYDSGDHLHPSPAGYAAMAAAVPIAAFTENGPEIAIPSDDLPAPRPLPRGDRRMALTAAISNTRKEAGAPATYVSGSGAGQGR